MCFLFNKHYKEIDKQQQSKDIKFLLFLFLSLNVLLIISFELCIYSDIDII